MNSISQTNNASATTSTASASRTNSITSAALVLAHQQPAPSVPVGAVPDEVLSHARTSSTIFFPDEEGQNEDIVHKAIDNNDDKNNNTNANDDENNYFIHISDIGSYDVLCRSSESQASFEIDPSSSHVGNARFKIMLSILSLRSNEQRSNKGNATATACGDDTVAANIIRTLYDECNGRILLPKDKNSSTDIYFRDIGNTPDAIDMVKSVLATSPVKSVLATSPSPSASSSTSPIPSTPAGEPSSPTYGRCRKRSSFVYFNDDVPPRGSTSSDPASPRSNKCRRRSSLKPSSYGAGAMVPADGSTSSSTPASSGSDHVHFADPIAPTDITSADVILPTIHEATFLRPDSGVGNNRLRVMVRMVSSRYFEATSSGDDNDAQSIAEEVVRQVNNHRDREGNRGRFLDTTYDENDNEEDGADMHVEVPHDVAIGAVCSFLDEASGIRTSAIAAKAVPTTITKSRKRGNSIKKNKKDRPSKKLFSVKLLRGVPVPSHLMPSNIASLRRDAAEDMRKKKAKKVTSKSGRTVHGGAKGFSSTLCDSQITKMQDLFRSVAEGGGASNAKSTTSDISSAPKMPSSLLHVAQTTSASSQKTPDSTAMAADVSFRGIPTLSRNHLKQPQARAA